jgi:hypothetical protein
MDEQLEKELNEYNIRREKYISKSVPRNRDTIKLQELNATVIELLDQGVKSEDITIVIDVSAYEDYAEIEDVTLEGNRPATEDELRTDLETAKEFRRQEEKRKKEGEHLTKLKDLQEFNRLKQKLGL